MRTKSIWKGLGIALFFFVYNASIGLSQVVYPVWVNDGLKQVNDSYLSNRYPETEYFVYASTWAFNNESDYPIAVNELREKLQKILLLKSSLMSRALSLSTMKAIIIANHK